MKVQNKYSLKCLIFLSILCFAAPAKSQDQQSSRSILLLIDASGSMMGIKMDSVKSAAKQIINMLLPCNTEFAIMGFTGDKINPVPYRLDFTTSKTDLFAFINRLKPWGGTRIGAALKIGSLYLNAHKQINKSAQQTIVLLSDGRSDDNIFDALKELKERNVNIQTECIGYDLLRDKTAEDQLRYLAVQTGGEYYSAIGASNVAKAFFKTSIKTIIHDVPVVVRMCDKTLDFKQAATDVYKKLTSQNWFLDSIQINVSEGLFEMAQLITDENMQDTMPKSLVFENSKKISLFIDKGNDEKNYQKWVDGNFTFADNTLSISILQYYFKLVVKAIDKRSLVLCVNKFAFITGDYKEPEDMICDCSNTVSNENPYILVYFSKAGCE